MQVQLNNGHKYFTPEIPLRPRFFRDVNNYRWGNCTSFFRFTGPMNMLGHPPAYEFGIVQDGPGFPHRHGACRTFIA